MHTRTQRILLACLVLGGCSLAVTASAQVNPEEGGVWVPPPDDSPPPQQQQQQQQWYQGQQQPQQQPQPPPQQQQPQTVQSTTTQPQPPSDGRSDHSRMVGRLAVGYMGLTSVPIGTAGGAGFDLGSVTAPAIGIRFWLADLVGIDVGIGLGFTGGNVESGSNSVPIDNAFAMIIHGGVPLAVFHQQHYTFVIIPEVNLAFSTGTAYGPDPDFDRGRSGFLFQIGGRLGTEIHFGFMNIPQLTLQASVGLYFNYATAGLGGNRIGSVDRVGVSTYELGTTVMGEPWDIFLGSLTALYYF